MHHFRAIAGDECMARADNSAVDHDLHDSVFRQTPGDLLRAEMTISDHALERNGSSHGSVPRVQHGLLLVGRNVASCS